MGRIQWSGFVPRQRTSEPLLVSHPSRASSIESDCVLGMRLDGAPRFSGESPKNGRGATWRPLQVRSELIPLCAKDGKITGKLTERIFVVE